MILASSHFGYPLSTTHVVSGAVTGSGVGRPGAQVDWTVARRIVFGWVLTLPAAGVTAAVVYWITDLFGGGQRGRADRGHHQSSPSPASSCGAPTRRPGRSRRLGAPPTTSQQPAPASPRTRGGGRMSLLADSIVDWGALLEVI